MNLEYFTINTILLLSALNYFLLTNKLHLFPGHTKPNLTCTFSTKSGII